MNRVTYQVQENVVSEHEAPYPIRVTASILCVLSPIRVPTSPLTIGALSAVFLLPVILRGLLTSRVRHAILSILALGVVSGLFLTGISIDHGRTYSAQTATQQILIVASTVLTIFTLCYCFNILGPRKGLLLAAVGLTVSVMVVTRTTPENPWKYGLGAAVSLGVLAAAAGWTRILQAILCLLLSLVGLINGSRSLALVLLVTAMILVITATLRSERSKPTRIAGIGAAILVAWSAIGLVSNTALSGNFGATLAKRQSVQSAHGGLLGGRTEYGAFFSLFLHNPVGYGFGVRPSAFDAATGKYGMRSVGGGGGGDYVDKEMFGAWIELHSISSDLWVQLGVAGLALAATILVMYLRLGYHAVAYGSPMAGVFLFVAINGTWDLFFSPLYANYIALAVYISAVALIHSSASKHQHGAFGDHKTRSQLERSHYGSSNRLEDRPVHVPRS